MIAYGAMLQRTVAAADKMRDEEGVKPEVIDLQTISPLDDRGIQDSVQKTGRVVIVHEAPRSFGPAGELIARIVEKSFLMLEAPVARVTGYDVHFPYLAREQAYMPDEGRILAAARQTLDF
jgi:pyruvate dehydrogenase E1 component beta subunit